MTLNVGSSDSGDDVNQSGPVESYHVEDTVLCSGTHVRVCPLLLAGGQWLLTLNEGAVHVFSVKSGRRVHVLGDQCNSDGIVSVAHDPANPRQVSTLSRAGVLCVWDVLLATLIHKHSVATLTGNPAIVSRLENFHHVSTNCQLFIAVSRASNNSNNQRSSLADLMSVSLPSSFNIVASSAITNNDDDDDDDYDSSENRRTPRSSVLLKRVLCRSEDMISARGYCSVPVVFACHERVVAAITSRAANNISVRAIPGAACAHHVPLLQHLQVLRGDIQRPFTCLAGHPREPCLAAGDSSGRVLVWRDLLVSGAGDTPPPCTVLHWHTLAVSSVVFSAGDDCQLFSGGGECVLVTWPLHNDAVKPRFLPRLGMPIQHVLTAPHHSAADSDNSSVVVVAHQDNVLRVINPEKGWVTQIIRGLVVSDRWTQCAVRLAVSSRPSHALVLNAAAGQLQFLSATAAAASEVSCHELFSLDITSTNYITGERQARSAAYCDVTHVAFSGDCEWLITMETACGSANQREYTDIINDVACDDRLKFWRFCASRQQYVLNTCVDEPHDGRVLDLTTAPSIGECRQLTATAGDDGCVKLWQIVQLSEISGASVSWSCCASLQHRAVSVAQCVSLSPDCTSVAAVFGSCVVLWRVSSDVGWLSCTRRGVYNVTGCRLPLLQLYLTSSNNHLYIVTRNSSSILVWRTDCAALHAQINISSVYMTVHPTSSVMAVFYQHTAPNARKTTVFVSLYHVHTERVLCEHQLNIDSLMTASFDTGNLTLRNGTMHLMLYYLSGQMSLHSLSVLPSGRRAELPTTAISPEFSDFDGAGCQMPQTAFSVLMAQKRTVDPGVRSNIESVMRSSDDVTQSSLSVLDSSSHTLSAMDVICSSYVERLLPAVQSSDSGLSNPEKLMENDESNTNNELSSHNSEISSYTSLSRSLNKLSHSDFSFLVS